MLILTRHIGEKVRIGDDITVVIVDAWGQQARIGVDAPRGVPVHRKEVYDLVKQVTTARIRIDRRQFLPSW
jgi:carbon storage regulator